MVRKIVFVLAALTGAFGVAYAANNWTGTNNSGALITFCSKDTGSSVQANCVVPTDIVGVPVVGGTGGSLLSAATNNSTNIKNAAGELLGLVVVNTTASLVDLRLYNSASAPTCSSATNLVWNIPIQANTTSAGIAIPIPGGMSFSSGIGFCLTGANANNDNTNAVTGVNVNYWYN